MSKLLNIMLILIVTIGLFDYKQCFGQAIPIVEYADSKYYLIDSLDISTLSQSDKEIIENSLRKYHVANSDTNKIIIIESIVG